MFWPLVTAISLQLAVGTPAAKPAPAAPASTWQQTASYQSPSYDEAAEQQMLDMANAERRRLGLSPLKSDGGLAMAARAHAAEMASQDQLSHQFVGEPSLPQRLSGYSELNFNRSGENVAEAMTPQQAHQALMASPPHRANLLNPDFNVVGMGVVRRGPSLFITEDFAASQATYSVQQAQALVEESIEQLREQANAPRLQLVNNQGMADSACAMAQADSLNAAAPPPGAYMLRYASTTPEVIPSKISAVIAQRGLHTYSAGTCYARTPRYPNGAYWVVLVFY